MSLESSECDHDICDTAIVHVTPAQDIIDDPDSISLIEFDVVDNGIDPLWIGHKIEPVHVIVDSVPVSACHVFSDPHIVTFDGARYDLYMSGTFLLTKSKHGEHETHVRLWPCDGKVHVSCVCGFVTRDYNDVVSVDMCDGDYGDSLPKVSLSNLVGDNIKTSLFEARGGKILMIHFESGRSIHVFLEYWGMSISTIASGSDYGFTR